MIRTIAAIAAAIAAAIGTPAHAIDHDLEHRKFVASTRATHRGDVSECRRADKHRSMCWLSAPGDQRVMVWFLTDPSIKLVVDAKRTCAEFAAALWEPQDRDRKVDGVEVVDGAGAMCRLQWRR